MLSSQTAFVKLLVLNQYHLREQHLYRTVAAWVSTNVCRSLRARNDAAQNYKCEHS